ncbi:MAG: class I SAM-dependent methyltransferase [Winogradskyella sp.]|uniref:O-methyltransferase n=1 Tax=Winogradskyella sp. TaxID=1883156 RepID=UPI0017F4D164|nr:class I SAM-dependent methyltransferase [Winogradskyella sp.]MBT8245971.1 class I SAM-dependent methyltransferase [Winogradskyella sp.]NNK23260.1 class I SAM-dependent methyltransferase [Winogradskyella sp.]
MYQLIAYIKFLLKSTNQHGVHSPFVYNFITKCLYNKIAYSEYKQLKNYRKQLLQSNQTLQIKDFVVGSKRMRQNKRRISKMVKNSSSSFKDTKLLFRISKYFQFKNTLELGTSLGVGTQALALGNLNNKIIIIKGCPETHQFSKQQFNLQKHSNITAINSDFESAIPELNDKTFDCIFFDGHHNKQATLKYFNLLKHKAHNDSVFIFDDIYWSKGMIEAWGEVIKDISVTVSIDCFNLGFVFFRKEQLKEHFTIRL